MKTNTQFPYALLVMLLATFGFNSSLNAQCYETLGSSTNMLSTLNNRANQVIVNNDLNTVLFIHRNNVSLFGGDNGSFKYDISTDNGATWQTELGSLNPGSTLGVNGGRYPQVGIYNPDGNTDIANASLVYHGPTTAGFGWNGYVTGSLLLDGSSSSSENYNQAGVSNTSVPGGFCQGAPGTFWTIDIITADGFNTTGVRILEGNYSAGDVTWSVNTELFPDFNTDLFGSASIADWNIAFDPSGQYGWVLLLTHLNGLSDYNYHPVFYNTTDGGATWTGPVQLDLYGFSSITSVEPAPALAHESDLTVDSDGRPHALIGVFKASNYFYSVNTAPFGHMYDFTYDGNNWSAINVSQVSHSFYFHTGGATYNRPQVTRSDDGSKIVFTWVESDLPSSSGNAPNLKAVTYDIPTGNLSCVINYALECPSALDGMMYQTSVSPNMIEEGGIFTVPVVLAVENYTGSGGFEPAQYYYLNGLQFTAADFTTVAAPTYPSITVYGDNPFCAPGSVELTASQSSSYLWSTGETTQTITAYGGNYWVVNPDEGFCIGSSNSVSVEAVYPPDIYVYSMSPVLCPGGNTVELYAWYTSAGNSIEWSNGATGQLISVSEPGSYSVTVDGCTSLYSVEVTAGTAPANDNICNAQPLTIGVVTPFDNTCATVEAGEPLPPLVPYENGNQDGWFDDSFMGAPVLNNTVWFSFIAPSTGAVNITTEGFDTQIALYSSSNYNCDGTLSLIAANDDGDYYANSIINRAYCLKKGKTYFVQVDGAYGSQYPGTIVVTAVPNTVTICHQTGNGESETITVSGCALAAHLAHGDQIGACPEEKSSIASSEPDATSHSLVVYPNPSSDMMNISFTSDAEANYTMRVFDINGRVILEENNSATIGENELQIDLQSFTPGIYLLILNTGNDLMQTKILKE